MNGQQEVQPEVQMKTPLQVLQQKRKIVTVTLLLLFGLVMLYGLMAGAVTIPVRDIISGLLDDQALAHRIVWDLRIPRVLVGCLVGMCLAMAGTLLQGVMRNPLADPGIIGVSSGAGLMATMIMILYVQHTAFLPLAAFLGALLTALLIYGLAWKKGATPTRIILIGIAINSVIGATMSALMLLNSDRVQAVLPWLAGGLSGVGWAQVQMVGGYAVVALVLALFGAKHVRVLMLGDEVAKLLGHRVERSRFFLIVLSALLSGIAVSVSGLIGFVGLVVPHIIRLIIGNDTRYLLPLSALGGGVLVVLADSIARSWFDPIELPVGILLSFLGGPFFMLLIFKEGGKRGAQR